jgi:phosphate transport system substrate-binding protein
VVVNPSNPINELTLEQLKKIFTGAYANWKEVGGNDGVIVALSRESSSGTYVFFQEHVLKKEDYTPKVRLMPATSAIIQSAASDALAIGYVGLGYAADAGGGVKVLKVKADAAAPAIAPSEDTVRDGTYSISRPLHFYTGAGVGPAADDFIKFCLSGAGQTIVREAGYIPVQ